eukprot:500030-Pyramimonas_sp.AAC.1
MATTGDISYVAQNMPISDQVSRNLDKALLAGVHDLLGVDLPGDLGAEHHCWFLPWRDGGMGLHSAYHSAEAFYL